MYDIMARGANFFLLLRPWILFAFTMYLIFIGAAAAISPKVRDNSQNLIMGGVIGIVVSLAAGSISESIVGVFGLTSVLTMLI